MNELLVRLNILRLTTSTTMAFVPKHNQVGFLKKPEGSTGFEQIVDFLKGTHIREQELKAIIDTYEYTISESSVRNKLKLADENSITELPNAEIFEGMANLGYPIDNTFTFWKKHFTPNCKFMIHHILHCISSKSGGWDQFGSKLAIALICLSTGRTYNFYKMIFEAMVANVTSKKKFLMYPRFLSMVLEAKPIKTNLYLAYQLTKKIFGNMNRGFAGVNRPLLANMITGHNENQASPEPQPTSPPKSTPLQGPTSTYAEDTRINVADLLQLGRNLGKEDVFETPKGKDSGEADISLSGLQAVETLVQVASQKIKTYTRRVKSSLKKKLDVEVSYGDRKFKSASEKIKSGFTNISSGEVRVSQRKGKEVLEEQPQPKRSKKQIRKEEANLAEIARIQAQEAAKIERKVELEILDALAAKRLNDEFEMPEQQRKRVAEVQQQAQYSTEEDWDLIRARMEASIELRKSVFGTDIDAED
ncbi:hypothetical protein Tco_0450050 [Tanacetum coccineum]